MKMQNELLSPGGGLVIDLAVKPGDKVEPKQLFLRAS